MAFPVMVAYATEYGSTQEVAEAITQVLRESGLAVDLQPAKEVLSLAGCGAVVLGGPLLMFHWHHDALRFLARHQKELAERPSAVFALGPTHVPYDAQEWQGAREQLDKELAAYPWFHPAVLEIFGGRYDPTKLRIPLKWFAGKVPASDIRDWQAIRAWAAAMPDKLAIR